MYNLVLQSQWQIGKDITQWKCSVILKSQKSAMEKAYALNSDWGSNLFSSFYIVWNKRLNLSNLNPSIYNEDINHILDLIMIK